MWIVWRTGSPDPSRPSPAIHVDDPAKGRDRSGHLAEILVARAHHGMTIAQLLTIETYNLPRQARSSIDGDTTKVVDDGGKRVPATIEA